MNSSVVCVTPHDPQLRVIAAGLELGGVSVSLGRACLADGTCYTWLEY